MRLALYRPNNLQAQQQFEAGVAVLERQLHDLGLAFRAYQVCPE
jgi:hypothetical protein